MRPIQPRQCYDATFLKAFHTALSMRLVMALICAPGPSSTCGQMVSVRVALDDKHTATARRHSMVRLRHSGSEA